MAAPWAQRLAAFYSSPAAVDCHEALLANLLRELRDDRARDTLKVVLLGPLMEYPALLCPSCVVGEETALELMAIFAQCPAKSLQFRCHLLVALTSVLLCTSCVGEASVASQDFLRLLLQIAQDSGDPQGGAGVPSLRATACECLRELEACCPGLLVQHMELLSALRQAEMSWLHQAFVGLQVVTLRNSVYLLSKDTGAGPQDLQALLGGDAPGSWEAGLSAGRGGDAERPLLSPLTLGPMSAVPTVRAGPDCKELRGVLSSLLEESYLLTPLCQAAALHRLIEVVAMVPGVPPAIFRAQLLRLLGTSEVSLLHCTLLMKAAFTDSLFSGEDEAFLLKRLVMLSQHPLLSSALKLFYTDCLLHFPENQPITSSDSEEAPPVLLTPRLAAPLLPTLFDDNATMLARLRLLSLVYLEEAEHGDGEEGSGLGHLRDFLLALLAVVERHGKRELVVTFFRAAFLFLLHFEQVAAPCELLAKALSELYLAHTHLAPHMINMVDRTGEALLESGWSVGLLRALQHVITTATPTLPDLRWHLKVLARIAEEGKISQHATLSFLFSVATSPPSAGTNGDWRLGRGLLDVCRRLLVHPSLDSLLIPLADVLQHLACNHGDTDIRDHARFYYSLLTTLSPQKLAAVLAQGGAEGRGQTKARTLSSIVAESEELCGALTIRPTEKVVLKLVEEPDQEPPEIQAHTGGDMEVPMPGEAALQAYRAQFETTGFAAEVELKSRLVHAEPDGDPRFDRLFSIRLSFERTDDRYEELSEVGVACVFRDRPAPAVRIRLRPRRPFPSVLRCWAVFACQDGLTWMSPLPDLQVAFHNLFMPLPAPPSWGPALRLSVFQELWREMDRTSEEATGSSAVSLVCRPLQAKALAVLVEKHFPRFLVSERNEEDEYKILIFLPPTSHLLLRLCPKGDGAHFHIATDDWRLLSHINHFLLSITTA